MRQTHLLAALALSLSGAKGAYDFGLTCEAHATCRANCEPGPDGGPAGTAVGGATWPTGDTNEETRGAVGAFGGGMNNWCPYGANIGTSCMVTRNGGGMCGGCDPVSYWQNLVIEHDASTGKSYIDVSQGCTFRGSGGTGHDHGGGCGGPCPSNAGKTHYAQSVWNPFSCRNGVMSYAHLNLGTDAVLATGTTLHDGASDYPRGSNSAECTYPDGTTKTLSIGAGYQTGHSLDDCAGASSLRLGTTGKCGGLQVRSDRPGCSSHSDCAQCVDGCPNRHFIYVTWLKPPSLPPVPPSLPPPPLQPPSQPPSLPPPPLPPAAPNNAELHELVLSLSAKVAELKAKVLAGHGFGCANITETEEGTCRIQHADGGAHLDMAIIPP